jgi:solute:Na+ symporter, SSS family
LTFELLPAGLRAIVLAAMLAAIMSSLDSALNAAASLVTMDLVRPRRSSIDDVTLSRIGRSVTAIFMIIAALYAPLISHFGSLFAYFQSTLAYLVPPFVAVYLGGLLLPRLSRSSAFCALLIIEPLALTAYLAQEVTGLWGALGLPEIHFTYAAIAGLTLTLALMSFLSLVKTPEADALDPESTFMRRDLAPEPTPTRRGVFDYRVQAFLLMMATALLLAVISWG